MRSARALMREDGALPFLLQALRIGEQALGVLYGVSGVRKVQNSGTKDWGPHSTPEIPGMRWAFQRLECVGGSIFTPERTFDSVQVHIHSIPRILTRMYEFL